MVVAVCLRCWHWERTTVEHFDEGVYASNLWFGPSAEGPSAGGPSGVGPEVGGQYPQRHLYAPPLNSWLIDWSMVAHGSIAGQVAMWPSLAAGCVSIGLVWWLARSVGASGGWASGDGGAPAALGTAALASVSGLHVELSRSALTDGQLGCWFLLSMILFLTALRRSNWGWFAASGVVVALAWWTKYNGWLPLFVWLVGLASDHWLARRSAGEWWRRVAGWVATAATAGLLWLPYWWSLREQGGYASVAANHRRYLVGLAGWPESLARQLGNLTYLGGWGAADLISLLLGTAGAVWLVLFRWRWRWHRRPCDLAVEAEGDFTGWSMAVWCLLLAAMTPLYTPYPRLMLPWLLGCWIFAGRVLAEGTAARAKWLRSLSWGIVLLLVGGTVGNAVRQGYWPNRTHLARIAAEIAATVTTPVSETAGSRPLEWVAVYTYGEPALFFHLRAAGLGAVQPIQTLDLTPASVAGTPIPTFLAVGPHALRDPQFLGDWPRYESRYEVVRSYRFQPSPLVLLDNDSAITLVREPPTSEIRLYRLRSDWPEFRPMP